MLGSSNLDRRLNCHVPWYQVLQILGYAPQIAALPVVVVCPLCQRQSLRICEFSSRGGGWHHCDHCRSTGDMIELAARCWKIDLRSAAIRLAAEGLGLPSTLLLPDRLAAYVKKVERRQNGMRQLLQTAASRAQETDSPFHVMLLEALQVAEYRGVAAWCERAGRMIGITDCDELDQQLRGCNADDRGKNRVFGRGWKQLAIVPFFDLPGRLSGVLAVGRKARRDRDWVFCPAGVPDQRKPGSDQIETGLACYDMLLGNTLQGPYGKSKFIGPVEEVLPLQARHLQDSSFPLPLAGFLTGRGPLGGKSYGYQCLRACQQLIGQEVIFWDKEPTGNLFNMASRCHGRIVLTAHRARPSTTRMPVHHLTYYYRESLPWQALLEEVLLRSNLRVREEILRDLHLEDYQLQDLYRTASVEVRELLSRNLNRQSIATTALVGRKRVMCTPAGWISEPGGVRLTDACLYIDQTILRTDTGDTYYRGRIVHRDRTYPFTDKAAVVEQNTFRWMRETVSKAGGPLIQYSGIQRQSVVQIAMQFHPPTHSESEGRFGWSDRHHAILLPNFEMPIGKRVRIKEASLLDEQSPARDVKWFEDRPPSADMFQDTAELRLFWASTAALLCNILAPAWRKTESGLGLVGLGAILIGRTAAKCLGCQVHDIPVNKTDQASMEQLDRAMLAHRWPTVVNPPRSSNGQRVLLTWLRMPSQRNVVLELDRKLAAGLKVHPGWRFVLHDEPVASTDLLHRHGTVAAFAWLEHILINKLQLPGQADESQGTRVLQSMQQWAEGLGYDPTVFAAAERLLDETSGDLENLAVHFAATIFRLLEEKQMQIAPAGFEESPRTTCVIDQEGVLGRNVFVPKRIVHDCLLNDGLPLWDSTQVVAALRQDGGLVDEMTYRGVDGWLLARPWWDYQEKIYRLRRQRILRVVG